MYHDIISAQINIFHPNIKPFDQTVNILQFSIIDIANGVHLL